MLHLRWVARCPKADFFWGFFFAFLANPQTQHVYAEPTLPETMRPRLQSRSTVRSRNITRVGSAAPPAPFSKTQPSRLRVSRRPQEALWAGIGLLQAAGVCRGHWPPTWGTQHRQHGQAAAEATVEMLLTAPLWARTPREPHVPSVLHVSPPPALCPHPHDCPCSIPLSPR